MAKIEGLLQTDDQPAEMVPHFLRHNVKITRLRRVAWQSVKTHHRSSGAFYRYAGLQGSQS
jgi:hypothetical protein